VRPLASTLLAVAATLAAAGCKDELKLETAHRAAIGEMRMVDPSAWCQVQPREATRDGVVLYLALPSVALQRSTESNPCSPESVLDLERKASELATLNARKGYMVEERRAYGLNRDGTPAVEDTPEPPDITVLVSIVRFTG